MNSTPEVAAGGGSLDWIVRRFSRQEKYPTRINTGSPVGKPSKNDNLKNPK